MKLRLLPAFAALCALFAVAASSCREDTIISASVTPSIDNVHTFGDTVGIISTSVYDDSALTSLNTTPGNSPIGWLNGDVYSGNTAGSLYMQVVPSSSGYKLTDDPDSGYIILPYSNFSWGDTTSSHTQGYHAFAIKDTTFSKDSLYYSFAKKDTDPMEISSGTNYFTFRGAMADSVRVNGTNVTPHLRIKLTTAFLQRLRQIMNGSTDSTYAAFTAALPGIYIVPDSSVSQTSMPYFRVDPVSASDPYGQAGIVLYKHHSATDSGIATLTVNPTYAAHFTHINRTYTTQAVRDLFNPASTASMVLLQNAPGAAIDVKIPGVKLLPKNVIINKCELVITQVPLPGDNMYTHPPRILPVGIDANGARYTILDRYPTTSTAPLDFIDGNAKDEVVGGEAVTHYFVNFPRELQRAIVQNKDTLHLRIGGSATYPAAYRLAAGSSKNPTALYRMKLNIVYSKQ